jgi:hypothetical protein
MNSSIQIRFALSALAAGSMLTASGVQSISPPPVIDMHVHRTNTTPEVLLGRVATQNLRFFFLSGLVADLPLGAQRSSRIYICPGSSSRVKTAALPLPGGRASVAPTSFRTSTG